MQSHCSVVELYTAPFSQPVDMDRGSKDLRPCIASASSCHIRQVGPLKPLLHWHCRSVALNIPPFWHTDSVHAICSGQHMIPLLPHTSCGNLNWPHASPEVPTGQVHVVLLKGVPPFIHSMHRSGAHANGLDVTAVASAPCYSRHVDPPYAPTQSHNLVFELQLPPFRHLGHSREQQRDKEPFQVVRGIKSIHCPCSSNLPHNVPEKFGRQMQSKPPSVLLQVPPLSQGGDGKLHSLTSTSQRVSVQPSLQRHTKKPGTFTHSPFAQGSVVHSLTSVWQLLPVHAGGQLQR